MGSGLPDEWHILRWDILVTLCELGVWCCVGMCECFCEGSLKLCSFFVQSC